MLENFLHLRKSRGQGCELFGACVARGQQSRDEVTTFFSNDVTVRLWYFCDQAMRAQQPQPASHCRHFFVLLLFVLGRRIKMATQITVSKPVERKLPAVDNGHEFSVAVADWIDNGSRRAVRDGRLVQLARPPGFAHGLQPERSGIAR